jgi:hypothetical protein
VGFIRADGVQRRLALNIVKPEGVKGLSGYRRSYQRLKITPASKGFKADLFSAEDKRPKP